MVRAQLDIAPFAECDYHDKHQKHRYREHVESAECRRDIGQVGIAGRTNHQQQDDNHCRCEYRYEDGVVPEPFFSVMTLSLLSGAGGV